MEDPPQEAEELQDDQADPQAEHQDDQEDGQQDKDEQLDDQPENCEEDQYEVEDPQDEQMGEQPDEQQDEHLDSLHDERDDPHEVEHDEPMDEAREDQAPENGDGEQEGENEQGDQRDEPDKFDPKGDHGDVEDLDAADQEQDAEQDHKDTQDEPAEQGSKEAHPGRCEVDLEESEKDPAEEAEAAPEWNSKQEVEQAYVECEEDAPEDSRSRIQPKTFSVSSSHSTMNVMSPDGRLLLPVSDRGFQHLVAAARATAGLKQGRYLFEVRIVELRRSIEPGKQRVPKQFCGIGFCSDDSSLFLGYDEGSMGFDSEGCLCRDGRRSWMDGLNDRIKLDRQVVIGVLLNLDAQSPNANTLSLFVNGERLGRPQGLPEHLKGRVLYPLINFKNAACLTLRKLSCFKPLTA